MFFRVILTIALVISLTGCTTTKKSLTVKQQEELQTKVTELESQLQEKDQQIRGLEESLQKSQKGESEWVESGEYTSEGKLSNKQIQRALKNAGYYSGAIDGKIGRGTTRAIKAFQQDNGLEMDGVVGRRTKAKLMKYLE